MLIISKDCYNKGEETRGIANSYITKFVIKNKKILFPTFSFSNLDLDEYMNRGEQEKLFKFILEESAEKMKKELVSQKYNLRPLHIYS